MSEHKRKVIMSDTKWNNMNLDAQTISFYRCNPCIAAEDLLGIKLLDKILSPYIVIYRRKCSSKQGKSSDR